METGTRGTSAKEAAADVVLALLADREIDGTISNTRMALRKLRGGKVGTETPFRLEDGRDRRRRNHMRRGMEGDRGRRRRAAVKDRWPKSLRVFKAAMETASATTASRCSPYGGEGPTVRAVPSARSAREFMAAYPADAGDAKAKDRRQAKAFTRALKQARDKELIRSREIGGIDYLWLGRD